MNSDSQICRLVKPPISSYKKYKSVSINLEESCEYSFVEEPPVLFEEVSKETVLDMKKNDKASEKAPHCIMKLY